MTNLSPRNVINFPKQHRKADCQGERVPYPISLKERIDSIRACQGPEMTTADAQHEQDARQGEEIIERWARRLADNPRRSPSEAASILYAIAGRINGGDAA